MILKDPENEALKNQLRQEVIAMTSRYPLIREA